MRDVGVKTEPRRIAAHLGGTTARLFPLAVLFAFVTCGVIRASGAPAWVFVAFVLAWTAGVVALAARAARRQPIMVVKVAASGRNQITWLLLAPFLLLDLNAALVARPLLIPTGIFTVVVALLLRRTRGRTPEVLRELRPMIAADEAVLGDGIGIVRGLRRWDEAFRLVVATDRRLLLAGSPRSPAGLLLVDVPYDRVTKFGIEWTLGGRIGALSLTVAGDDEPSTTHVISSMSPANLLSVALALRSHGVAADDPEMVAEAERAWEHARRRDRSRTRLIDRAAMNTLEFDRGLWLLLGLAAFTFYLNPFGVGIGISRDSVLVMLLGVAAACGAAGYVARTRASLAYLVPLNLLVAPALFFARAGDVIFLMLLLSSVAALGLWAGSAARGETARGAAPSADGRPAPGSLRYALGGLGLIRLSAVVLATLGVLVGAGAAAGFDRTTLRMAIEQATARQVPVDGRSNLTGDVASVAYTPGPDLHELITDQRFGADAGDGARWELRSSWTKGLNVVSLATYVEEPRLDNPAAIADFVARKDRQHAGLAGFRVTHTERTVDGHKAYVWDHGSRTGYWYYAAWLPRPVHSVRVECIAKRQAARFRQLCTQAIGSLRIHAP